MTSFWKQKKIAKLKINDKGIDRIAFVTSLILHLLLLILSFPVKKMDVSIQPKPYRIPVQIQLNEPKKETPKPNPKPKKKIKKKTVEKQTVKKKIVAAKKAKTKLATANIDTKPTRLPGDRDDPIVSEAFQPVYPKSALNNDWEGEVHLLVSIDPKGRPTKVKVKKSTGHPSLDQAFTRTVETYYRFKPKRMMGKDVSGKILLKYHFKLEDDE